MCEFLLRDIEMLYTLGLTLKIASYPQVELDRLWKLVLLNQFHDVLPGSSIGIVYQDAIKYYEDVVKSAIILKSNVLILLSPARLKEATHFSTLNTLSWSRDAQVVSVPNTADFKFQSCQLSSDGKHAFIQIPEVAPLSITNNSINQTLSSSSFVKGMFVIDSSK